MKTIQLSHDEAQTRAIAAELVRNAPPGAFIALYGELGAGKTCFVQGIATALGVRDAVTSPTFAIANEYFTTGSGPSAGKRVLVHADLYRLSGPRELGSIGWDDYLDSGTFMAVEWPERAADELPPHAIRVTIRQLPGSDTREIIISKP